MTAESHDYHKNLLLGILLTCVAHGFFNISDAALKLVAMKFHFSQIVFVNGVLMTVLLCAYGWITEKKKAFQTKKMKLMLMRGGLAQAITIGNILALPHVPLSTFYTLVFTSPLWVVVISSLFLGDRLDKTRLAVVLSGFAMILFIFRPGSEMFSIWALVILFVAFLYSCQLLMMRQIGKSESRVYMALVGAVMGVVWSAPFLPFYYVAPTAYEWGIFLMMALIAGIGILAMAYGFQVTPSASAVAPYHYTQIVWGSLLGYFIFREVPDIRTIAGATVIILAGLYLIFSETQRKKKQLAGF